MKPQPAPTKDWSQGTVVIAASGPSLTADDVAAAAGHHMIVINTTFRMAPRAEVLYAADSAFLNAYWPEIKTAYHGEVWSCSEDSRQRLKTFHVKLLHREGLSRKPNTIHGGGNSGYQAINLAALWGAKRIVLLGFDFQRTNDMEHWHGPHEHGLHNSKNFPTWIKAMNVLARDLLHAGIQVINASRATALDCFPRMTIQEALH